MDFRLNYHVAAMVLLLCILCRGGWSANDRIAGGSNWPASPYQPDVSADEMGLHPHLDGTITRLGPGSKELWTFFSGSNLISASNFYLDADDATTGKPSMEFDGVIDEGGSQVIKFSVKNHSFCVYDKGNEEMEIVTSPENDSLKRTPIAIMTWDEVVNRTPQLTVDGGVIIGSKSTTVFYLDGATGALIRKFEAASDTLSNLGSNLEGQDLSRFVDDSVQEPLFLVRTDYAVQSLDVETGIVRWNVSMGSFSVLPHRASGISETPILGTRLAVRPIPLFNTKRHPSVPLGGSSATLQLPGSRQDLPALAAASAVKPEPSPTPEKGIVATYSKPVGVAFSIVICLLLSLSLWKPIVKALLATKPKQQVNMGTGGKKKKHRKQGGTYGNASSSTITPTKPTSGEICMSSTPDEDGGSGSKLVGPASKKDKRADLVDEGGGKKVGRLLVSSVVIGRGSHGTVVLEGSLDGRNVAIKKILVQFHEKALKEIAALIETDEHPNVVRCYALEEDAAFVYVALERCNWNLNDLIVQAFGRSTLDTAGTVSSSNVSLIQKSDLWVEDQPSLLHLQLMRDIVAGLAHLHSRNIVHRDLKPQNVLVVNVNGRQWRAKLSDMGISKRIDADDSSFDTLTGSGSPGWRSPEQLRRERQTRSVDMFSLGCVLYFCITGGQHPFGGQFERDRNIMHDQFDIFLIQHLPEASHLIRSLIRQDPKLRPQAQEVLVHPFFWTAEERLSFLTAASDRVELEDREDNSSVLEAMEAVGSVALSGSWGEKLDIALIENLGKYRRYNYWSVRDLLRVIRNKSNHYRELPQNVKDLLGPHPGGYVSYFSTKFPLLTIEVYKVLQLQCRDEHAFRKFFFSNQDL